MLHVPQDMERIVDGIRYRVDAATLIADDQYWDGSNHERNGRNRFLYRTPNGRYFVVTLTMWQGEQDALLPISPDDARAAYEEACTEHHVEYEEAFPDVTVTEA